MDLLMALPLCLLLRVHHYHPALPFRPAPALRGTDRCHCSSLSEDRCLSFASFILRITRSRLYLGLYTCSDRLSITHWGTEPSVVVAEGAVEEGETMLALLASGALVFFSIADPDLSAP
jgi:hypothetical protein